MTGYGKPKGTDRKYTYADYADWDDHRRYELIDGVAYMLAAPSVAHQDVVAELITQLRTYLRGKTCKAYPAPFDVRLHAEAGDDTVVQPDITVVCDPKKTENGKGCKGVPDMVVEVLSPATAQRDQVLKFNQYLHAGVREYWIVYPQARSVVTYLLKDGEYVCHAYSDADTVSVRVLDGCQIELGLVFPAEEKVEEAAKSPKLG